MSAPAYREDRKLAERYPVMVRPLDAEDGGGFLATVPDLPGCMSDGETEAEAIENARDAIVSWLRSARKHGDPIPPPNQTARYSGKFIVRMPPRLHASLSEKARYQGVSLNEYVTTVLAADVGGTKLAPSGSKVPDRNLSRNRQHGPKNKKAPAAR